MCVVNARAFVCVCACMCVRFHPDLGQRWCTVAARPPQPPAAVPLLGAFFFPIFYLRLYDFFLSCMRDRLTRVAVFLRR